MVGKSQRPKTKNPKYKDFVSDISTETTSDIISESSERESESDEESISESITKALPQVRNIETLLPTERLDRFYHKKLKLKNLYVELEKNDVIVHQTENLENNQKISIQPGNENNEETHRRVESILESDSVDDLFNQSEDCFETNIIREHLNNSSNGQMNQIRDDTPTPPLADNFCNQDHTDAIKLLRSNSERLGKLVKIASQMEREVQKMKTIAETETLPSLPDCFPLRTLEDWKTFNQSNNEIEDQTIKNYFASLGGRKANESVNLMIAEAIDPNLAIELTWTGTGKNNKADPEKTVNKSRFMHVCYGALAFCNRFGLITQDDLQIFFTAGLKAAKERKRTSDKKQQKPQDYNETKSSDEDDFDASE